jgi:hypothetical protein
MKITASAVSLMVADVTASSGFLRRGLPTLPDDQRDELTEEEWGERAFQVRDPNGVIVELVDWKGAAR